MKMQMTSLCIFPAMFLPVFSADFNCFITAMELFNTLWLAVMRNWCRTLHDE